LEGRKTAIRQKARDTKKEATEMMATYLGGEEEALEGFEFLSMAEASELSHWEIVETMAEMIDQSDAHRLATWAVGVQREHVEAVRRASLALAAEQIRASVGASRMFSLAPRDLEFSEAYIDGDETAHWQSAAGHSPSTGARASGSSIIVVPPGRRLPRHTDSAEETIVVVAGAAAVATGGEPAVLPAGGVAVVAEDVPHEVRNAGDEELTFVAVYAAPDVVTRYEQPVQPDGKRERHTVS
jgi:quercetin dioxygenase-like cupin family protein